MSPITDRYISLCETSHNNPYDDPEFLKIEDVAGFITLFKIFAKGRVAERDIKSLKSYRNRLKKKICEECVRFRNEQKGIDAYTIHTTIKKLNVPASISHKKKVTYDLHTVKIANCNGCRVLELKKALSGIVKTLW